MYWYYKYPLYCILILLLTGVSVFIWRSSISPYFHQEKPAPVEVDLPTEEPPEDLSSLPPPATRPASNASQTRPGKPVQVPPVNPASNVAAPTFKPAPAKPAVRATSIPGDLQAKLSGLRTLVVESPLKARQEAQELLSQCTEYDASWLALARIIDQANKKFMSGTAPCPEKATYTVVPSDSLSKISGKVGTTVGALQRLNKLSKTSAIIRPGQTFQYFPCEWSIRVSKSQFLLCLYHGKQLFRIYRISTGQYDRTPVGTFVISTKTMNPAWYDGTHKIPYGDPRNILGTRWMGIQATGDTDPSLRGFGIHGTTEPDSIGTASSLGCVRMLNSEVEELYDFIPEPKGSFTVPVTITE
ncbi:MAG: L,D-transpeptidase family protein [Victivallales bacterium]|nr:L,D-transpeptidase family protein [Victivallales bacterium]